MKRIYLDHNATTPVDPEVLKKMLPYFGEEYGNASSLHSFGRYAREAVENARLQVARLIGPVEPVDIVFTSGGTESDNFAVKGAAYALKDKGRHIITSKIEHHAVLNACEFLAKNGYEVTYLAVDEYGLVDMEALKSAIRKDTILISIMFANNEVGTVEPVKEIAKIAREKGILFHTDAVQALGKIDIDVESLGIDLLSISAHKIYGPKGVGALCMNKKAKLTPLMHGGHHERNRRAGTENVPGIVGFGKACELAAGNMKAEMKRIEVLRDRLWQGIIKSIEDVKLNGHPTLGLPNTLNVSFKYVEGESVLLNLDLKGIAASSGSACTSGSLEPSHVLKAMSVEPATVQGSVRFSLGSENTEAEIDRVVKELPPIIKKLRDMSPLYKNSE
ncbi:MAG: cysteine desulfurase NifS [Candidatus Omnitrophica bacterium]|nr:cysteine desulfurase NifS [Candidatus Omnitrophota bacterium]MBU4488292.1 cysteine desulfurase NifS [Candidatus Omnitrophota bacterium]MCG2704492.1 cysteine desulfurase NifS [Candidatus Omnitrophota bacterium]